MKESVPVQFLRRSKVAQLLDCSIPVVDGMIKQGRLRTVLVGHRQRVPMSALNDLARNAQSEPPEAA
jgi:hypothetical protein